jgi:hypothetical protein
MLNILDTRLNTEIETPTAASSTGPICPMNAVSTKEASGSAASANAAGNAIEAISRPSPSLVNALLKEKQWQHMEKMSRKLQQYHHTCYFETKLIPPGQGHCIH